MPSASGDSWKGTFPGGHFTKTLPDGGASFSWRFIPFIIVWVLFVAVVIAYLFINFVVPEPRKPTKSEKTYKTLDKDGEVTDSVELPCWFDESVIRYKEAKKAGKTIAIEKEIDTGDLFLTVVVPAFNEEKRLLGMLEETVHYLETNYSGSKSAKSGAVTSETISEDSTTIRQRNVPSKGASASEAGWEILLIDDGSKDHTVEVAQEFSRSHLLPRLPRRMSGPWSHRAEKAVNIPPDSIRVVSLEQNRGKGGAVTHGMRHARGKYIVFADADGASDFTDVSKLVSACQRVADQDGRAVAVGSRAHLVGSEAVVKRSKLRNFLMHSFHLILKFMTPAKTAQIKDTQCGFKMFTRPSLPYIIPHMHTEGWIFDVEMLMLAEFANIPMTEVAIGWREVPGSKLNVLVDSIGMAWGLAILRFCWLVGIYRS